MKVKAVLKSLLFAYGMTGLFLLLLAFLLFQFDLGEASMMAGITAIYALASFLGGFMSGKLLRKNKYFWGVVVGLSYFALLVLASTFVQGKWDMSLRHGLTTVLMCAGGGALGGMLS